MLHGPAKLCSVKSSKFACSRNYSMYSNVSYEPYGIRGCLPKKHGLSSFAHLRFTVPAFLLPNHPHRSCYDENKIQTISHKTSKSQVVTTCTPKLALILIIIYYNSYIDYIYISHTLVYIPLSPSCFVPYTPIAAPLERAAALLFATAATADWSQARCVAHLWFALGRGGRGFGPHHGKNDAEKAEKAAIVFFSWVV